MYGSATAIPSAAWVAHECFHLLERAREHAAHQHAHAHGAPHQHHHHDELSDSSTHRHGALVDLLLELDAAHAGQERGSEGATQLSMLRLPEHLRPSIQSAAVQSHDHTDRPAPAATTRHSVGFLESPLRPPRGAGAL
jgi:hypothetical protein